MLSSIKAIKNSRKWVELMFQEKTIQSSIKNLDENKLLKAYGEFINEFTKALKLKFKDKLDE